MSAVSAERCFSKGLAALAAGHPGEAAESFRAAMQIERQHGVARPNIRFLSYYGLSLARARRSTAAAVRACEVAVQYDPVNPALLLNLGRVYLMAGKRAQALGCFERGIRHAPSHRPLRRELSAAERRAKPLIGWLDRAHLLNRWTGRIRAALTGLRVPAHRRHATP